VRQVAKVCKGRWCPASLATEVPDKLGKSPCTENFSLSGKEDGKKNARIS